MGGGVAARSDSRAGWAVFFFPGGLERFPDAFFAWIALRIVSRASILPGWPPGSLPEPPSCLDNAPDGYPSRHLSWMSVREAKKRAGIAKNRSGSAETPPSSFKTDPGALRSR
jgi:hypothetical protein